MSQRKYDKEENLITLPPIKATPSKRDKMKQVINKFLENGLIDESSSVYSSPAIIVYNEDLKDYDLLVDYRKLNATLGYEEWPFPKADNLTDLTYDCSYFTILHLSQMLFQINIDDQYTERTAFVTMDGKYQWNRMPYGLISGPPSSQKKLHHFLIHNQLNGFAMNFLDKIIIFSKTFDLHQEHLSAVLGACAVDNIKMDVGRCQFATSQANFLGQTISHNTIKPLKSNIDSIFSRLPSNHKEMRKFIDTINFYGFFIETLLSLLAPLKAFTKRSVKFKLGLEQRQSFQHLKEIFSISELQPYLTIMNPKNVPHILLNPSEIGIQATLMQKVANISTLKPVAYFHKPATKFQAKFNPIELDCFALTKAVKKWRHYLENRRFLVYSDHLTNEWFHSQKKSNTKLLIWTVLLKDFDFVVLSRRSLP